MSKTMKPPSSLLFYERVAALAMCITLLLRLVLGVALIAAIHKDPMLSEAELNPSLVFAVFIPLDILQVFLFFITLGNGLVKLYCRYPKWFPYLLAVAEENNSVWDDVERIHSDIEKGRVPGYLSTSQRGKGMVFCLRMMRSVCGG